MKNPQLGNWQKAGVILGVVLTIALIVNTSLMAYVTYQNSFTASMAQPSGESLDISLRGDVGRPSPLTYYLKQARNWISAYYTGGVERTNAETGIVVAIDGSNIGSTASVDYYIEAKETEGEGSAYRFLEGNSTSVTVNGADLDLSNQTTIENHLSAMGLSTTSSHTIDYYVYVKAEATGAISEETLTSEIEKTLFDSVTFEYGTEVSDTFYSTGSLVNFQQYPTYTESMSTFKVQRWTGKYCYGYLLFPLSGVGEVVTDAQLTYRCFSVYSARDMAVYRITETWGMSTNKPTWSNMPTFETEDVATQTPTDYWNYLDITEMGQAWGGGAGKFGIMMNIPAGVSSDAGHTVFGYQGDFPPYIDVTWVSYSASWYPVPASVLDMPLGQTLGAFTVIAISAYTIYQALKKEKKRK